MELKVEAVPRFSSQSVGAVEASTRCSGRSDSMLASRVGNASLVGNDSSHGCVAVDGEMRPAGVFCCESMERLSGCPTDSASSRLVSGLDKSLITGVRQHSAGSLPIPSPANRRWNTRQLRSCGTFSTMSHDWLR